MKITLEETLIAFILATGMGFIIAFVLWLSEYTRKISEPYLVVLNSLPKVALGPIIIIWMGAGKKCDNYNGYTYCYYSHHYVCTQFIFVVRQGYDTFVQITWCK